MTLSRMFETYSVELEIMVTGEPQDTFTNIIHLTKGNDHGEPGDRMPAIFLLQHKLHICSYVNDNANHAYNSQNALPLFIWTKVVVRQAIVDGKYMYSILINNFEEHLIENTTPIELDNVKVYASNPWHATDTNAKIRNFKLGKIVDLTMFILPLDIK